MDTILHQKQLPNKMNAMIAIITLIFLLLWLIVSIDKLTTFDAFIRGIYRQPVPSWLHAPLAYGIPPIELLTGLLLCFSATRLLGFYFSFILMLLFTGYVGIALIGGWGKDPCICGAIFKGIRWKGHFVFNLSLLMLSAYGIFLIKKQASVIRNSGSHGVSA